MAESGDHATDAINGPNGPNRPVPTGCIILPARQLLPQAGTIIRAGMRRRCKLIRVHLHTDGRFLSWCHCAILCSLGRKIDRDTYNVIMLMRKVFRARVKLQEKKSCNRMSYKERKKIHRRRIVSG